MEAVESTMTALVHRPTPTPSATATPKPTATPTSTRVPTWTPSITPTCTPSPSATPTNTPVPTPDVPEGWLEHVDITDKFSFWAPRRLTVDKQKAGETWLSGGRLFLSVSVLGDRGCAYRADDEDRFINCCVAWAADGVDRRGRDFLLKEKGASRTGPHWAAIVDYAQLSEVTPTPATELPDDGQGEELVVAFACAREIYIPYPQTGQLVRVMALVENAREFSKAEESDIALIASSLRAEELRSPTVTPTPTLARSPSRGEVIARETLVALAVEATLTALASQPTSTRHPETTAAEAEGTVTAEALNLRSGPGLDFAVLAIIHGGDTVQVAGRDEEGDWLLVTTSEGWRGWVGAKHIAYGPRVDDIPISTTAEAPTGG